MPGTIKVKRTLFALLATAGMAAATAGCDLFGALSPLPFSQVTSVQLFTEPSFTVAFSVDAAVAKPALIAKVRWVFGDGSGFVEGPPNVRSITHRYDATGSFEVTAFLFGADGFVDQITTTINVEDDGQGPGPDPTPAEDLPEAASSPFPTDGAEEVPVDTTLSWLPGLFSESHDVYLGTIQADVENADAADPVIFRGNQTDLQFDPQGLDPDTEYFWRVDEVNAAGATKGIVFSFRTAKAPDAAESPVPANRSSSARVDQVLQWVAGIGATSHDVYFGKDSTAVTDATTDTADIFQDNQSATSFDPADDTADIDGQLLADTDYFWRIDEVGPGGTTKGTVWRFHTQVPPPKIMTPVPADADTDVGLTQIVSWTASPSVESFDVYLGIGTVDVADATRTSTEFRGNQTTKNFNPSPLIGSTQYFWRIDTLGPGGTTHGDVLSFTTAGPPSQVIGPFTPANGVSNVDIETMLLWSAGTGTTTTTIFEVFLSTSSNAVLNRQGAAFQSSQDVTLTSFEPSTALNPGTQYFWSIDAIGPGGTTAGAVLSFTTGNQPQLVENPDPTISATGVALDKVLAWGSSVGAASYDVYFDTNQSSVQNADLQSVQFRGNVATTTFMPGAIFPSGLLDGNTQYFWRIDAKGPGGTTTGDVFRFTTGPDQATDPMPMDDDLGVDVNTQLSWTASSSATSYDVYLGTVLADVESATNTDLTGIFRDNVTVTNFDPAGLMPVTIYYWRIDAVDDAGTGATTKGEIWTFTTGGDQASAPTPATGASGVSLTPMLDWTVGTGAVDQDIYFGTDQTTVENADRTSPVFQGTFPVAGGPPPFNPSPLNGITTYFWRVDSVTADGTTTGEVWQFITGPDKATTPLPAIFATDVSLSTLLQWAAGNGAASHDVYLITEADDMALPTAQQIANANNTHVPPFVANVALTRFDPGMLLANTVYLWRIDEVAADGTTISQGDVWRFTTTTGPDQVTGPMPVNNDLGVDVNAQLSWTASSSATSYDVYLGTVLNDVESATNADLTGIFRHNVTVTNFDPAGLMPVTIYYWRIDAVDDVVTGATTKGEIWTFTTGADQATAPTPASGASGVSLTPMLDWTVGTGAVDQDIYFGTDQSIVQNADRTSPVFQGTFPVAGGPPPFNPGQLNGITTHFWRVDSVTADGTTTGEVWQFITGPGKATSPMPANFATDVPLTTLLQWTSGTGAATHDVYLITETDDMALPTAQRIANANNTHVPPFVANVALTRFDPGMLLANTVYLWRIDEVAADGTTISQGDVWRFTTLGPPQQAGSPMPFNGDANVDSTVTTTLNWAAADGAASYDVFFGTTMTPASQGNQTTRSFNPGTLAAGTTYFWRIDAVNEAGTTTGVLWSFTTLP